MLKKVWLMTALIALVCSIAACGGGGGNGPSPTVSPVYTPTAGAEQTPPAGQDTEAMAIYKGNCMACHATDLKGSGNFPSLQEVGSKYSESEISNIIHNGQNGMPAFKGRLTEQEITTLSKWLAEKK